MLMVMFMSPWKSLIFMDVFLVEQSCSLMSRNEWQAIINVSDAWTRKHVSAGYNLIIQLTLILKPYWNRSPASSHTSLNESKPDQSDKLKLFSPQTCFNLFAQQSQRTQTCFTQKAHNSRCQQSSYCKAALQKLASMMSRKLKKKVSLRWCLLTC